MLKTINLIILVGFLLFMQSSSTIRADDIDYDGENYVIKEVLFVPWDKYGNIDSLLGFRPHCVELDENGDTIFIEPGYGVRSWDVGLDGKIYIADEVKARIAVYDSIGKFLRNIGIWDHDSNEIHVKATSGKVIAVHSQNPRFSQPYKTYFKYPKDVAVDGKGNVYIPTGNAVMMFTPEGVLVEILNEFGGYTKKDMKMGIGSIFSDAYGNLYIDISLKDTYVFAKYNSTGEFVSVTEKMVYRQDAKGNLYEKLRGTKDEPNPCIKIRIFKSKSIEESPEQRTIYFETSIPDGANLLAVDEDGNFYILRGWAIQKFDQMGNMLANIPAYRDSTRTFKIAMPGMNAFTKIMANGDLYGAYMSDQGFVVVKHELQQETKGRILKPAYIPEDMKK